MEKGKRDVRGGQTEQELTCLRQGVCWSSSDGQVSSPGCWPGCPGDPGSPVKERVSGVNQGPAGLPPRSPFHTSWSPKSPFEALKRMCGGGGMENPLISSFNNYPDF